MTLLRIESLFKSFGGLTVTSNCSLTVEAGEIHALIGPNGAGKTTLINQISGTLKPDRGQIFFNEKNITRLPAYRRVHLGLARTYQITNIFKNYTVLDNLVLGVQARSGSSFRFWQPVRREARLFEEAAAIAEEIGLGARQHVVASQLSHGEQRQLEIGLALVTHPKLLLLDEPTAGMGMDESAQMVKFISKLNQTMTILLIEHDMNAVFELANRISVLVYGNIIATGTPEEIHANPEVQQAYLGDESYVA